MLYDQLRTRFSLGTVGDLLIHGTCSAIVGQLVAWPFDMIRRWYMRSGCEIISNEMNSQQVGVDTKGKSMLQVSRYLYTRHGLGGFWQPASMLPGIAKVVMDRCVSYKSLQVILFCLDAIRCYTLYGEFYLDGTSKFIYSNCLWIIFKFYAMSILYPDYFHDICMN